MHIGIFGGSFNPIHNGHIALARQLLSLAALDEVWFMVSPQNPLKQGATDLLDDYLRYSLTRLALYDEPQLSACPLELHLPKPSYTWTTLQQLRASCPHHRFTLLIGGDNWQLFPRWYKAADILRHHRLVVYPRQGSTIDANQLPDGVTLANTPLLDISSTRIRQYVKENLPIDHLVPKLIAPVVKRVYAK